MISLKWSCLWSTWEVEMKCTLHSVWKMISFKFCPGKCYIYMGGHLAWVHLQYSARVGMLLLTKMEIMVHTKYFFQGLCEELFLKNWPYKHRGFYSSCGSIPVLALGGKPSSYERCHCYCIPDSKNFHFTIVQKYRLNCGAHSDTQVSDTK